MRVRDDPERPDPHFAELYGALPPATALEPWLTWCLAARTQVLYLGIGTGRLAEPLAAGGARLVGVDASAAMLARLHRRLPGLAAHLARIEELSFGPVFDLVIAPSNILGGSRELEAAAAQLAPGGRVGFELMNPHWLRAGGAPGVRLLADRGADVDIEVDYVLPDGQVWTQEAAAMPLHPPEAAESRLERAGLLESPTYYVLAAAPPGRSPRHRPAAGRPEAAPGRAARGRPRPRAGR